MSILDQKTEMNDQQRIEHYHINVDGHVNLYTHAFVTNRMHQSTLSLYPDALRQIVRSRFSVVGNYSVINASMFQCFVA